MLKELFKKNKSKERVTVVLPTEIADRIKFLRHNMGNATNSKVIGTSLDALDFIIEAKNNGEKIYFENPNGRQTEFDVRLKPEQEQRTLGK